MSGSEREAKRWSRAYRNRLVQGDLPQWAYVHDLGKLELLSLRLPREYTKMATTNIIRKFTE